jgi:IclR family acetate operon transcriptional repressor
MPATVPAAARTMAVFEVFAREKRELLNSDVARFLNMPESSCSDLLHTLYEAGFLMRTPRTRRFYPTSRLFVTASEITKNDPLYIAAVEAIELLTEKTGETTFAGRLDEGASKVVAVQEGRHSLRYMLQVGERIALHASALGKALMGGLPAAEMARQLRLKPMRKITPATLTDLTLLEQQIAMQRDRGWYSVDEEGNEGVTAYALSGLVGDDPLAISVAGPTDRMHRNREDYLAALHQVATVTFTGYLNQTIQAEANGHASVLCT